MGVLGWIFWTTAVAGVAAVPAAVVFPQRRPALLSLAAGLLLVAGLLAILSIGILLVLAATGCAGWAWAERRRTGAETDVAGDTGTDRPAERA